MKPERALPQTMDCLCLAARRAARAITREFDQALRAHGLRATQFSLLSALHLAGPKSIGELAELLSADRTTLTRNLAVAEHNAWLTLRPDRDDARSRIAAITAKGLRALEAALPAWRRTQQRLHDEMGDETAASLRRLAGGPCAAAPPSRTRRKPMSKSQPAIRH